VKRGAPDPRSLFANPCADSCPSAIQVGTASLQNHAAASEQKASENLQEQSPSHLEDDDAQGSLVRDNEMEIIETPAATRAPSTAVPAPAEPTAAFRASIGAPTLTSMVSSPASAPAHLLLSVRPDATAGPRKRPLEEHLSTPKAAVLHAATSLLGSTGANADNKHAMGLAALRTQFGRTSSIKMGGSKLPGDEHTRAAGAGAGNFAPHRNEAPVQLSTLRSTEITTPSTTAGGAQQRQQRMPQVEVSPTHRLGTHGSLGTLSSLGSLPPPSASQRTDATVRTLMGAANVKAVMEGASVNLSSSSQALVPTVLRNAQPPGTSSGDKTFRLPTPPRMLAPDHEPLLSQPTMGRAEPGASLRALAPRLGFGSDDVAACDGAAADAPLAAHSSADTKEVARKERVRQETREQVPALTKMKQTLNAYRVSFARMTSDALTSAWKPEFEYALTELCDSVQELKETETELEHAESISMTPPQSACASPAHALDDGCSGREQSCRVEMRDAAADTDLFGLPTDSPMPCSSQCSSSDEDIAAPMDMDGSAPVE
jgi:hypothetical protein